MMRLLLMGLLFVLGSPLFAQAEPDSLFQKGNRAYEAGQFEQAIAAYQEALQATETSAAALHNNLGLAYFAAKDLGRARLHFERAHRLDAASEEIQHHLKMVQQYQKDDIYQLEPFFLIAWWNALRDSASSNAWALLCLFSTFAFAGLWIWRWQKDQAWSLPVAALLLCLLFGSLAAQSHQQTVARDTAVVLVEEAALHQEAQIGSPSLRNLHAGAKVELLKKEGDWQQVRLANAEKGWILAELVEAI